MYHYLLITKYQINNNFRAK